MEETDLRAPSPDSDGKGRSVGGSCGRGCSSVGRVCAPHPGSAGGSGEAVRTLKTLVGVERLWRISAAGSSGKSVKSIDPVGSAAE